MATTKQKFSTFGKHLRALRVETEKSLREVASHLDIHPSLLAKIERNEKQPTQQLIKAVADYFNADEKGLQNEFLSDQIAYKILDEGTDLTILKVEEQKVSYLKTKRNG
ncbi:MAG: helix-turn-helix domain-containing protein [Candidatus Kapaibacterium sp.]